MSKQISELEMIALARVGSSAGSIATHWVAGACGFREDTSKGRRLLLKLAKVGLVEGVTTRSGRVFWWKVTDAGRAILAGLDKQPRI